ncbi:MAG TPA: hypothetical protein VFR12_05655 [Pyrinomonadaceae bacterium]|nr:hypothetical protein [Pyrinomonadaceae bacterium]
MQPRAEVFRGGTQRLETDPRWNTFRSYPLALNQCGPTGTAIAPTSDVQNQ